MDSEIMRKKTTSLALWRLVRDYTNNTKQIMRGVKCNTWIASQRDCKDGIQKWRTSHFVMLLIGNHLSCSLPKEICDDFKKERCEVESL